MKLRAVEWFRPLIGAQQWDYIVVWKLGDDPSRFIEWMGCCCSGGYDCGNVQDENESQEKHHLTRPCRDDYLKHSVRTKACEDLAQLPTSMTLFSGVHTEVVISRQPRWLGQVDGSGSNPCHQDFGGTRALIPVLGGLIELYASKHIPKDQKVLELILAHCNISLEEETMAKYSCINMSPNNVLSFDALPENCPFLLQLPSLSPRLQVLFPLTQCEFGSHTGVEGLSRTSSSNHSNEQLLFDSSCANKSQCEHLKQSFEKSHGLEKLDNNGNFLKPQAGLVLDDHEVEKTATKVIRRKARGDCRSTNIVSERNRRFRIKEGLLSLRSIVPKITKMDNASTLGDAINYIRELQKEEKELQDELKKMDCPKNKDGFTIPESGKAKAVPGCLPLGAKIQNFSFFGPKQKTEVNVEVNQIGKKECFIKLLCDHKQRGFTRLMEAIDSLELQVVNANLTTFNGKVQNILEVKADKDIEPKKLRDSLIELTG